MLRNAYFATTNINRLSLLHFLSVVSAWLKLRLFFGVSNKPLELHDSSPAVSFLSALSIFMILITFSINRNYHPWKYLLTNQWKGKKSSIKNQSVTQKITIQHQLQLLLSQWRVCCPPSLNQRPLLSKLWQDYWRWTPRSGTSLLWDVLPVSFVGPSSRLGQLSWEMLLM